MKRVMPMRFVKCSMPGIKLALTLFRLWSSIKNTSSRAASQSRSTLMPCSSAKTKYHPVHLTDLKTMICIDQLNATGTVWHMTLNRSMAKQLTVRELAAFVCDAVNPA